MGSKEEEYKEMFLSEALENYEELNNLFTKLEKDINNKKTIDHIFRITHTLKGNAMGMGFEAIAEMAHVMEDIFSEAKEGRIELAAELFESLYKANDKLGELIHAIKTDVKVNYKGIRTKLSVYLKNSKINQPELIDTMVPQTSSKNELNGLDLIESISMTDIAEEEIPEEDRTEEEQTQISFSDLVNVPVRKLDNLLNLVGELIIERDSLVAASAEKGYSSSMYARLQRITSDLQYGVMDVRLVQVGFLFKKFHRIIRDVAVLESKKVDLILEGTEIEIDRNILKIMSDSLIHLIRNSVSHGIEKPEDRKRKGKAETGKVILRAKNEKDTVIIEVIDDGNGMDHQVIAEKAVKKGIISREYAQSASKDELLMLIFEPGFSNAEVITEVSGRGVGMDVVKRATESIGGNIKIETEIDKGSVIRLSLPSSMAVKGALLFELNSQEYAVALSYTEAVISLIKSDIHKIGNSLMANYLGKTISVIFLNDLYQTSSLGELSHSEGLLHKTFDKIENDKKLDIVVASYGNKYVGFVVDKLLQQKEIVEKTLAPPINKIDLISGATILGNGNVCLVLDIANIINTLYKEKALIQ